MKIALLTPMYDGRAHDDYMRSVSASMRALAKDGHVVGWYTATNSAILYRARNQLVAQALADAADLLIWIDSDIGFDVASMRDLVAHLERGEAIVAGAPQKRSRRWNEAPGVAFRPFEEGPLRTDEHGLIPVRGLATAFLGSRAEVYRAMLEGHEARRVIIPGTDARTWPYSALYFWHGVEKIDDPVVLRAAAELGVDPDHLHQDVGEDYWFCERALELGFTPKLAPGLRLRHWEGRCVHDFAFEPSPAEGETP